MSANINRLAPAHESEERGANFPRPRQSKQTLFEKIQPFL
jgi:hypothetical protein